MSVTLDIFCYTTEDFILLSWCIVMMSWCQCSHFSLQSLGHMTRHWSQTTTFLNLTLNYFYTAFTMLWTWLILQSWDLFLLGSGLGMWTIAWPEAYWEHWDQSTLTRGNHRAVSSPLSHNKQSFFSVLQKLLWEGLPSIVTSRNNVIIYNFIKSLKKI